MKIKITTKVMFENNPLKMFLSSLIILAYKLIITIIVTYIDDVEDTHDDKDVKDIGQVSAGSIDLLKLDEKGRAIPVVESYPSKIRTAIHFEVEAL